MGPRISGSLPKTQDQRRKAGTGRATGAGIAANSG